MNDVIVYKRVSGDVLTKATWSPSAAMYTVEVKQRYRTLYSNRGRELAELLNDARLAEDRAVMLAWDKAGLL